MWEGSANSLLFVDAATPGASSRIFSLDLASARTAQIDHPPEGVDDWEPAISPDERFLSFGRTSAQPSENHWVIHDLRTGREAWLTHVPPSNELSAWAEDSKSIFLEADAPGRSDLLWYPIDGGPERRLLTILSPINIGRLSSGPGGLLAAEYNNVRYNLVTLTAAGSPEIIDPANGVTWSPSFAPDGTLAMGSNRAGEVGIWLMRPGGPSRLLLLTPKSVPCCFIWSPDGAYFAYETNERSPSFRVVTAAGEEIAHIQVPGADAGQPAWMADGRSLVFPVRAAGEWRIWRAELSRPDQAAPITGYGWRSVRTDGDVLYGVRSSEAGVWRIGPPAVKLTGGPSIAQQGAWSIYRHQIIFPDPTHVAPLRLLCVPDGGGHQRLFATLPKAAAAGYDINFTIDPRTGVPVYVEEVTHDIDIALFHLARR